MIPTKWEKHHSEKVKRDPFAVMVFRYLQKERREIWKPKTVTESQKRIWDLREHVSAT
jgi:hypothetical protein